MTRPTSTPPPASPSSALLLPSERPTMADTTQPAGALPEPQSLITDADVGHRAYTADDMRALMAERDAAREERDIEQAFRAKHLKERDSLAAQVRQLAGAHVAWLDERGVIERALEVARGCYANLQAAADETAQQLVDARAERDALRRELEELRAPALTVKDACAKV